jgi:hypothetical protein
LNVAVKIEGTQSCPSGGARCRRSRAAGSFSSGASSLVAEGDAVAVRMASSPSCRGPRRPEGRDGRPRLLRRLHELTVQLYVRTGGLEERVRRVDELLEGGHRGGVGADSSTREGAPCRRSARCRRPGCRGRLRHVALDDEEPELDLEHDRLAHEHGPGSPAGSRSRQPRDRLPMKHTTSCPAASEP